MNPKTVPLSALCALAGLTLCLPPAFADPPTWLDRSIVAAATRRAIERAGLHVDAGRDLAIRARAAGWVPQIDLRVRRGLGTTATTDYQLDRATTGDSTVLEARVSFSLDRVVFDSSEVAIARLDADRAERRAAIERDVVDLLAAMERGRADQRRSVEGSDQARAAVLEFTRSRARLEVLLGAGIGDVLRRR